MKKKIKIILVSAILTVSVLSVGCGDDKQMQTEQKSTENQNIQYINTNKQNFITLTSDIVQLESGLSAVKYSQDYAFDAYIEQGGASSDSEVIDFITHNLTSDMAYLDFQGSTFGCSTISVKSSNEDMIFGRNFDWNNCNAMIVYANSDNDYASISTVNMDFINMKNSIFKKLPDKILTIAALYAPLDGMNEKGLCVAVNMIQDSDTINQNTDKPDITTTTAIRLLLNKAANVDEAIELLKQYDMHASMNMMVHFALADTSGKSVVVEYVDNEMIVTQTPVVTNFYLAQGEKYGIGTNQSHIRYENLISALEKNSTMDMNGVKDALDDVSKHNFGEFEATQWSIVFNQNSGEVHYYYKENYDKSYKFLME